MSFLKRLFCGFPAPQTDIYPFYVRCTRCGETIEGRINLNNDLSMDDDGGYYVRKVLMGSGRCFERLEVELQFDAARQLQSKHVNGGAFVENMPAGG
jgi:hypothetical protein